MSCRPPSWCDTCRVVVSDTHDSCPSCGGELIRFALARLVSARLVSTVDAIGRDVADARELPGPRLDGTADPEELESALRRLIEGRWM